MMSRVGIYAEKVSRSFGRTEAVRQATFTAEPGRVTGLIGPNGSGKTTVMLMLATLLRPDSGEIRVAGFDPVKDPLSVREQLGWMPDVLGIWDYLTTRETLEMTARMYRMGKRRAAQRTDELIELTGLEQLASRPSNLLSRGQKQRLNLARALVHDPSVLVLDEPASGLDPTARIGLREVLRSLAAEGKTVLVSSHVLAELDEIADAAVYLENGSTPSPDEIARASTSARQWRLRSLEPETLATTLAEIGVTDASSVVDKHGTLLSLRSEADAAELLRVLIERGVPVSWFAPAVGNLEHTFLDLTRGTL